MMKNKKEIMVIVVGCILCLIVVSVSICLYVDYKMNQREDDFKKKIKDGVVLPIDH